MKTISLFKYIFQSGLKAGCFKCGTFFTFAPENAFARFQVCGIINSGQFDRECVIYVRCPACKCRVNITGKVPYAVVKRNEDSLCKCGEMYCKCEEV